MKSMETEKEKGWRAYRREIQFLVIFLLLLGASFTVISLNSVNASVIEPFTGWVDRKSVV